MLDIRPRQPTAHDIAMHLHRAESTVCWQLRRGRDEWRDAVARYLDDEHREARMARRAVVLPIFGGVELLRGLKDLPVPDDASAEVWQHVKDRPAYGGGGGGGGGGPAAHAMPPGAAVAPLAHTAARSWTGTSALAVVGALALLQGIVIGALWDPLHGSHSSTPLDARPDAVVAAITASAAPSITPAPSAAPSSTASPAATHDLARTDILAERGVLMGAKDALDAGHINEARAALAAYARRWPGGGRLVDFRDLLRAQLSAAHPQAGAAP
jgi:hypothetical protein